MSVSSFIDVVYLNVTIGAISPSELGIIFMAKRTNRMLLTIANIKLVMVLIFSLLADFEVSNLLYIIHLNDEKSIQKYMIDNIH